MSTGYKNTKMMGRKRAREREIYMFAISYLRTHSTKTNKSVKARGNKKIPKEEAEDEEEAVAEAVDGKKSEHLMWIT